GALGHADGGELLGILGVADIDHRGAMRAAHMRHIGDVVLDHHLPAAGAIEIADLANTGPRPHDVLPCCSRAGRPATETQKPGDTRLAAATLEHDAPTWNRHRQAWPAKFRCM